VGVEWLSVGTADRSDIDTEARWIEAASMRRHGWSELRRRRGGVVGRSHGDDTEARWVASGR
jgi:gamma-glutamylcysteine synthetase